MHPTPENIIQIKLYLYFIINNNLSKSTTHHEWLNYCSINQSKSKRNRLKKMLLNGK